MAAFWPTADADPQGSPQQKAYSQLWKPMPKLAFSRSMADPSWNTRVVTDDLIDEFTLFVHPVALGGGRPLFAGLDHRLGLELAETRTFDPGVVQLRYRYSAGDTRL